MWALFLLHHYVVADALHLPANSEMIDGNHFRAQKKDARLDD
jgi:hypothetical protein